MSNGDELRSERMLLPFRAGESQIASLMTVASPNSGREITRHRLAPWPSFGTLHSKGFSVPAHHNQASRSALPDNSESALDGPCRALALEQQLSPSIKARIAVLAGFKPQPLS